ncbi:MAG: class I SAM-dependent methyltransferase [bacterium]
MTLRRPDIPGDNIQPPFEPLVIPLGVGDKDATAKIASSIRSGMERSRKWSGKDGVKKQIGEGNGEIVENILRIGGATLVEIGAGELQTTKELATFGSDNHIIAVDPFVSDASREALPRNITVVPKLLEETSRDELVPNSADVVISGGYTINYPSDKLAFLQRIYEVLKPEARAYMHFTGNLTDPSLIEIIAKFDLQEILSIMYTGSDIVLTMKKQIGKDLNFGRYESEIAQQGVSLETDTITNYKFFEEPTN